MRFGRDRRYVLWLPEALLSAVPIARQILIRSSRRVEHGRRQAIAPVTAPPRIPDAVPVYALNSVTCGTGTEGRPAIVAYRRVELWIRAHCADGPTAGSTGIAFADFSDWRSVRHRVRYCAIG
jgi:hypothetical protein